MKSKILSLLLLLPVLLIGAALIGPSFIDWNAHKPTIVKQVKDKTGFDLTIGGDITLAVFPVPSVTLQKVAVINKPHELIKVETVKVSVALFPLLSKNIKVEDIELVTPVIAVSVDGSGKGNWENDVLMAVSNNKNEGADNDSALKDFSIDDLKIKDGVLSFHDAKTGAMHKVEAINVDATLDSLSGPFSGNFLFKYNDREFDISGSIKSLSDLTKIPVDLALALDGDEVVASFKGDVAPQSQGAIGAFSLKGKDISQYAGTHASGPFDASGNLDYKSGHVKVDDFNAALSGLTFKGDVANKDNVIVLDLKETSGKVGNGLLGAVLSGASAKATLEMNETSFSFPSYDVSLKDSHLKGSGKFHFEKGLTLNLEADRLDVDAWQKLLPSTGSATTAASTGNKGFAVPVEASVFVNVGQLIYQGKKYESIVVDATTKKNSIVIRKVGGSMAHNTQLALKGKIGNTTTLSDLDLKASLKTSDADALLKSYNVNREAYAQKIGKLDVDVAINGSLDSTGFSTKVHNNGLTVNLSGVAKDLLGNKTFNDISLRLQHANIVNAIKIAQPSFSMDRAWQKPLDISLKLNMSDNNVSIDSIKGRAGLFPIESGALTVNTASTKPSLSGNLALGSVTLPKTASKKGDTSSKSGSKWSSDAIDTAWMNSFVADLDLKAKKISQNKWVFDNPSLDFNVKDGTLTVSQLKADMFNGDAVVSGKAVAAQNGKGFSSVALKADTKNLNAKSLYSAVKGTNSDMLNGVLTTASQDITTSGTSMASLMNNLTGKAAIKGERIVINGVDVTSFARAINGDFRGLNSLSDINNSVLFKGKTEFSTMTGQFDIAKGIVKLNPVTLDGPKALFDVTGTLDLPKWYIDIKNSVSVKGDGDDVPPFEMTFRGSLDNPVKSAGGDALNNLVKNKLNKILGDKDLAKEIGNKIGLDKLGIDLFRGQKKSQTSPTSEDGVEGGASDQGATTEDLLNDAVGNALGGLLNGF